MNPAVANVYKVPRALWRKWSVDHRELFNRVFAVMANQILFTHPKMKRIPAEQWDTIRWNAAVTAAAELKDMP